MLATIRKEMGLVTVPSKYGCFIRPVNREKRLEAMLKWKQDRKGFTRSFFCDESHVWLTPGSRMVVVDKTDRFGRVVPKPKHLQSVSDSCKS